MLAHILGALSPALLLFLHTALNFNKGPQLRLLLFPSTCLDLLFAPVSYLSLLCNKLPQYSLCLQAINSQLIIQFLWVKDPGHSFLGPLGLWVSQGVIKMKFQSSQGSNWAWGGGCGIYQVCPEAIGWIQPFISWNLLPFLPGGPSISSLCHDNQIYQREQVRVQRSRMELSL